MDSEKMGKYIAKLRKQKDMTQKELADKINVTDKAVSKWERGKGIPDIVNLEKLANVFGITIVELTAVKIMTMQIRITQIEKRKSGNLHYIRKRLKNII